MHYLDALRIRSREVGTTTSYNGYQYKVIDLLTLLICGCLCGLKNISDIHTYATSESSPQVFLEVFGITKISSYVQMTRILSIVDIDTLNSMFSLWSSYLSKDMSHLDLSKNENEIVAIDGKTIRSTTKMKSYERALHIVSAHATKTGITLGQLATESKSNEIPTVRELIKALDLRGTIRVTDALSCQKETIKTIIGIKYDKTFEKNRGRLEKREAWVLNDVSFLMQKR